MERQKELTNELIKASEAYYNGMDSGMSDLEFDRKVEELQKLEAESGVILPGSPTQKVGAKVEGLKIVKHEYPALSLSKVKYKDKEDLVNWFNNKPGIMSWKLDGSTIVLTYDNGKLTSAVTRGQDGIEGGDVTHNARYFKGVPASIPYKKHLVVRGEAFMKMAEFERVNALSDGIYENPRNLASATIQMHDSNESRKREICFKAFELVCPEPEEKIYVDVKGGSWPLRFMNERFEWLDMLGFDVVEYEHVNAHNVLDKIEEWQAKISDLDYPTDGLVFSYNDLYMGWSMGNTGHHPRWAVAMKWTDETVETYINDVEWSVGKTGIITPVAIFDQVRLGLGSNVTRASLHNLSVMQKLGVMIGSKVEVYLANMIIPQIASCTEGKWDVAVPEFCPVCGGKTYVDTSKNVAILKCTNSNCAAQRIGKLMNTFSKDGLYVKGLGESQLMDLIDIGLITDAKDVYTLKKRSAEDADTQHKVAHLLSRDGWGKKKWDNLLNAIEVSRDTTLQKFLYSLNVPLLGNDLSKKLTKHWHNDVNEVISFVDKISEYTFNYKNEILSGTNDDVKEIYRQSPGYKEISSIEGVGDEKALNVVKWADEVSAYREVYEDFRDLINELHFPEISETDNTSILSLEGLTFVITGSVSEYKNRDEFKASVEARGGKVSGSVSAKTSFLVNNDVESTSGKNKKAKELGIEIISEDEFINRFGK